MEDGPLLGWVNSAQELSWLERAFFMKASEYDRINDLPDFWGGPVGFFFPFVFETHGKRKRGWEFDHMKK